MTRKKLLHQLGITSMAHGVKSTEPLNFNLIMIHYLKAEYSKKHWLHMVGQDTGE